MIEIYCKAIGCEEIVTIEGPKGWTGDADVENSLTCPKESCRAQARWFEAVCPGCVEGYPDCKLQRAFAYGGHRRTITEAELSVIAQGRCPYRTNGTIGFSVRHHQAEALDIDISDRASSSDGQVVADAIRNYIAQYP